GRLRDGLSPTGGGLSLYKANRTVDAGNRQGWNGIPDVGKRAAGMIYSPETRGKRYGKGRMEGKPPFS
ncbi:hypothetical protein, partial [Laribacter hongkongensis]|uniref:hypothetical protein n=1 Tax=Laribacter hongkongensis TaxID=168471 RepID=UPI001EFC4D25